MAHRKAVIGTLAFLLIAVLAVGYFALAADIAGKDDPLITLSYLSGIEPQLKEKIDQMIEDETKERVKELDNQYAQAKDGLQKMIDGFTGSESLASDPVFIETVVNAVIAKMGASGTSSPGGAVPDTFKRVDLAKNKTVSLGMGSMVFLRLGSAACTTTSSPGLINLSDGSALENGGQLVKNNLYTSTFDSGRGFKITSDNTTVFICGPYTVS